MNIIVSPQRVGPESLTPVRGVGRADVLQAGPMLPGFRLPLQELFPPA